MEHNKICSKCGNPMKVIPIKKLDSTMMIEYFCDNCDRSITFYPDLKKIRFKKANYF